MKYITILILLFSISINSQEIQQVEVVKNDNQISELFEELGQGKSILAAESCSSRHASSKSILSHTA